jgi:hypothetical protein
MLRRSTRVLAAAFLCVGAFAAPSALAVQVISFGRQAGQPDSEAFGGTAVTVSEAIDLDTGTVAWSGITDSGFTQDLTAFHQFSNGDVWFSADTFMFGFPDVGTVNPGDIILYDAALDQYSVELANTTFNNPVPNVDGVSLSAAGNLLLTTKGANDLPGVGAFGAGDVIEWDGANGSLFLANSDVFTAGANNSVDAIHATTANSLIFSVLTNGIGQLGSNGLAYGSDSSDLFSIDLATKVVTRILDGENLWDSNNTRQTDAVFVPEPGTGLLLALGLVAMAARRR